jgi:hypothetical protein
MSPDPTSSSRNKQWFEGAFSRNREPKMTVTPINPSYSRERSDAARQEDWTMLPEDLSNLCLEETASSDFSEDIEIHSLRSASSCRLQQQQQRIIEGSLHPQYYPNMQLIPEDLSLAEVFQQAEMAEYQRRNAMNRYSSSDRSVPYPSIPPPPPQQALQPSLSLESRRIRLPQSYYDHNTHYVPVNYNERNIIHGESDNRFRHLASNNYERINWSSSTLDSDRMNSLPDLEHSSQSSYFDDFHFQPPPPPPSRMQQPLRSEANTYLSTRPTLHHQEEHPSYLPPPSSSSSSTSSPSIQITKQRLTQSPPQLRQYCNQQHTNSNCTSSRQVGTPGSMGTTSSNVYHPSFQYIPDRNAWSSSSALHNHVPYNNFRSEESFSQYPQQPSPRMMSRSQHIPDTRSPPLETNGTIRSTSDGNNYTYPHASDGGIDGVRSVSSSASTSSTLLEIEIAPGQYLSLRGSAETMRAIAMGKSVIATCWNCQVQLECIEDCTLVLCPDCRVVSPNEKSITTTTTTDSSELSSSSTTKRGVGLGLKIV